MEKINKQAGRPPKALKRRIGERKGVLDGPLNSSSVFELSHDNPDMFKAIFDACKKVSEDAHFIVSPDGVQIYCETKTQGCFALIEIFGAKVVGYYCREVRYFQCKCKTALSILKSKKKGQEKIRLSIPNSDLYTMKITMTTNDKINESSSLTLDFDEPKDISYYHSLYARVSEYPLHFTLKWAYFKELINNWDTFKPSAIFFEKDHETNLIIGIKEDVGCEAEFENPESIDLVFNHPDLISVGIPIVPISSVSPSVSLSKKLTFHVAENSELILSAKIDELYSTRDSPIVDTESATVKFFIQLKDTF